MTGPVNWREANTALRVLLSSVDDERTARDEEILTQIRTLVLPYLDKLRDQLDPAAPEMTWLDLASRNLEQVTSTLTDKLSDAFAVMTPTEIEIAQMVMSGKTTKDIARGAVTRDFDH